MMQRRNYSQYFIALIFFVLPIIIANQYYADDIGRSSGGYRMWLVDGRPFAEFIMTFFNLSETMSDLAPLPLIASCLLLSATLFLYRDKFLGKGFCAFIVSLSFIANPALTSLFSYRFDVLTFTFSIFFAFLPYLLKSKITPIYYLIGIASVVFGVGTYQISINIFTILAICELFYGLKHLHKPNEIAIRLVMRASQAVLAMSIYMYFILPLTFSGDHVSNHPSISNNIITTIINNSKAYFNFASDNFYRANGNAIIIGIFVILVISATSIIVKYMMSFERGSDVYAISFISFISSIMSLPLVVGAQLILSNSLEGVVHIYMAYGVYLLLAFTVFHYAFSIAKPLYIVIALLIFNSYSTMYAYGNSLRMQDLSNKRVADEIKTAISGYDFNSQYIVFNGQSPKAAVFANSSINYPILKYSVLDYYANWYWAIANLSMNGLPQLAPQYDMISFSQNNFCSFDEIYKSNTFNAYHKDNIVVIDFSKVHCD